MSAKHKNVAFFLPAKVSVIKVFILSTNLLCHILIKTGDEEHDVCHFYEDSSSQRCMIVGLSIVILLLS